MKDPSLLGEPKHSADVVSFSYAAPFTRRPRARFVRFKRVDKRNQAIILASIEVFDYSGTLLQPISISSFPADPGPFTPFASGQPLRAAARSDAFIQVDFGKEVEIAGVRITNAEGSLGASNIGCSVHVLTNTLISVFGVKIRDNRLVYSVRTCPPSPEAKHAQYLRHRPVQNHRHSLCCSSTHDPKRMAIEREARAVEAARRKPDTQSTWKPNVDFAAPLVGT